MSHTTFIQRIADHLLIRYDLRKQDVTVVFPNKRAGFCLRNAFKERGGQTLWMPQIISIEEAFTQWSGLAQADPIDLLFELIDIDAQLPHSPDHSSEVGAFGSQAMQMVKDFDEIDQYGIDAKQVFNYIMDNKKLELWDFDEVKSKEKELKYLHFFASLHEYYLQLRARLSAQRKGYYGMITRHLSELPPKELVRRIGDRQVVFAGLNALTTTEERIIDTLIKNGKAETLFDYDAYYVDDPNNEAGIYARRYQSRHPAWLKDGIVDRLRTEDKHIHIVSASGNALQAKALQAKLQDNPDESQAIVLADQNLLIPVLNGIPEAYSGFNVSMGYPVAKTTVNQFVKEYFLLRRRSRIRRQVHENGVERLAEGWYLWPVMHLMELELVQIIFPKQELEAFNRWKYEAVNSGKFILEDTDIHLMDSFPKIKTLLETILLGDDDKSPKGILERIDAILAYVARTVMENGDDNANRFLLNQVTEIGKIVSRLRQVVEQNAQYVSDAQSIEALYRVLSSGASLRLDSSDTDGLQIMGLLETRNLDFGRLYLLSVNEGILPPGKLQGSFIPSFIRRAFSLPGYAESQALVAYSFYRLLQNGRDIYLYYNNLGETSGGEPSRFILQIKRELARNANITVTEEAFVGSMPPTVNVQALHARKSEETLARLHYLTEQKGLSPSSLSTYLNCPLKYYLRYVVEIQDNCVEEETGANVIGSIIHDTLELLFEDYLPVDGKVQVIDQALFDTRIEPLWEQKLAQAITKNMPNGFPDVGFNYLNHVTIEQQLKHYLNYTSQQLSRHTLTLLNTESNLTATFGDGQSSYLMGGRADRIDQFDGKIRVIDYKTGHVDSGDLKVPVRRRSESNLDYLRQIPDKALQLLLYKYMYLKEHPTLSPDAVEGAIHGLRYPRNVEFVLTKTNPKKDDFDADASFLDDSTFVADMEAMLKAVVAEILAPDGIFVQADDDNKCSYCEFGLICKKRP